jgi:DNA-binding PadR family transcriptional regulator
VSPVFRHGRLRLYLLKLLDESPRHGYEVIRLLQDRFMGVYAPSPGTIYPRLARLEEEGLVTHDEADGRKVYRITDKGREELRSRPDDLSELEDEITASVRDIAREVTQDVRETVRNLREELTFAARDIHRHGPPPPRGARPPRGNSAPPGGSGWSDPGTYRDLEQLARRFTRELRAAAAQAQAVSEDAVGDLRTILDDTLDRIKAEVFGKPDAAPADAAQTGAAQADAAQTGAAQADAAQAGAAQADAARTGATRADAAPPAGSRTDGPRPGASREKVPPEDGPGDGGDPGRPR